VKDNIDFASDLGQQVSEQYRQYQAEISEINRKLIEIQNDKSETATAQRRKLFMRLDGLRAEIFNLIPFDRAGFEKYAERMLGHVRQIILNSAFMSDCIIGW